MLYILTGKSASGKDYILKLIKKYNIAKPLITMTTRPPRDNETNGIDYYFQSKNNFIKMLNGNKFIEHTKYKAYNNGIYEEWYYGTPIQSIDKTIDQVIILNPAGLKAMKQYAKKLNINIKTIYIDTDKSIRTARANLRSNNDPQEWNRRMARDDIDFINIEKQVDTVFNNNESICEEIMLQKIRNGIVK